jgi:hypothetical protein
MQKMRILQKNGTFIYQEWSYNPEENPDAKEKALQVLANSGIMNASIYEIALLCFWYSTPDKKINCMRY